MVGDRVEVAPEARVVDARRPPENRGGRLGVDHSLSSQGPQLPDGNGVACDDITPPLVEAPHDPTAVVAQLALADGLTHGPIVAPGATTMNVPRGGGRDAEECRAARGQGNEVEAVTMLGACAAARKDGRVSVGRRGPGAAVVTR